MPIPHLVWDSWMAESYRRGGWTVTEIRPGVWEIVNPNAGRSEAAKKATGTKR